MNPSRRNLLIGILLGIFLTGIFFYFRTTISEQAPPFLIGFLTCLALMTSLFLVLGIWFRKQIQDRLLGQQPKTESRPSDAFKNSLTSLAQQYLPQSSPQEVQSAIRFLQTLVWGRAVYTFLGVLVSIFIALGGILGSVLLFKQNALLEKQTEKIDIQNNLIEAERRSSLVFLMSNILDRVDEEIKEQRQEGRSERFRLSQPLVSRIVALSKAFRPYRMMEGDTLSGKLVSPERGQVFVALMENNLDSLTQQNIAVSGDFSYALIGKINLENAKLAGIKLSNANLSNANFSGADLSNANLSNANFSGADLSIADFSNSFLRGAHFRDSNLYGAALGSVDIYGAYFLDADLSGAYLGFVKNVRKEQLIITRTLYGVVELDPTLQAELKAEKSCLFEAQKYKNDKWIYPCDNN